MKLSTQLTVVMSVGIAALTVLIISLAVFASWDSGQVLTMVSGFGTVFTGVIVAVGVRGQQVQGAKLDTVVEQTNSLSDMAKQDIGERAAQVVMTRHDDGDIR